MTLRARIPAVVAMVYFLVGVAAVAIGFCWSCPFRADLVASGGGCLIGALWLGLWCWMVRGQS